MLLGLLTLGLLTLDLVTKKPSSPQVRTTEGSALALGACALVKYENSCHTRTLPPSTGGVNVRDNRSHDPDLSSQSQDRPPPDLLRSGGHRRPGSGDP